MKIYIYFLLIMFMFIVIYEAFKKNNKYSPIKIKILCTIVLMGMLLRYLTMFLMFIVQNIRYLYLLKPLYFLNFICIPIIAFIIFYILVRNDKINFSYMFFISFLLVGFYIFFIYKYPITLKVDIYYGYFIEIMQVPYAYVIYMIFNMCAIIFAGNLYNKNVNRKGIVLVILSASILIIEAILSFIGKEIFLNIVLSDILWIISLNYLLGKLKKSGR